MNFDLPNLKIQFYPGVQDKLATFHDLIGQVEEQGLELEIAYNTMTECSSGEYFDLDSAITKFADLSLEIYEKQVNCFCDVLGPEDTMRSTDNKRCAKCRARLFADKVGVRIE